MARTREHVQQLARHLQATIRGAGWTQHRVEQELGWGPGYLSHLLHGRFDLKLRHVYEVLEVIGEDPYRFFLGVYGRPREEPETEGEGRGLAPAQRQEILKLVEEQVGAVLAQLRARERRAKEKGGKAKGKGTKRPAKKPRKKRPEKGEPRSGNGQDQPNG